MREVEKLDQLLRKLFLSGLGVFALTQEKIEELVEELAKKGEISWGEKEDFLGEIIKRGKQEQAEVERKIGDKVEEILSRVNIASKDDIERLEKKIDELGKKRKT
jgi:polyhydroxyalkanoate synthesis regulator phasin